MFLARHFLMRFHVGSLIDWFSEKCYDDVERLKSIFFWCHFSF